MPSGALIARLLERIEPNALPGGTPWLAGLTASLVAGGDASPASEAFVAAARRLGRAPLPPGAPLPLTTPEGSPATLSVNSWTVDEAGRVALLLAVAAGSPDRVEELVNVVYGEGDTREKAAVVRALPLLPGGARWLELALDAGRTNELPLFAALACDNAYPGRHYPELQFNKLVMKAVFVGLNLHRVVGLARRANAELSRMAVEYIEQQLSAGRTFPADIWLAIALYPPNGAIRTITRDDVARAVATARAALESDTPPGAR